DSVRDRALEWGHSTVPDPSLPIPLRPAPETSQSAPPSPRRPDTKHNGPVPSGAVILFAPGPEGAPAHGRGPARSLRRSTIPPQPPAAGRRAGPAGAPGPARRPPTPAALSASSPAPRPAASASPRRPAAPRPGGRGRRTAAGPGDRAR